MKSTVKREQVLLYGLGQETERGARLHTLLQELRIPAREVRATELGETLGAVAGYPGYARTGIPYEGSAQEEPFLVMRDLDGKRLDELLRRMREEGIGPIPLKAVVTATNRDWTFLALMDELREEHRVMGAWRQLQQLAAQPDEGRMGSSPSYRSAIENARAYLSSGEQPTPEGIFQTLAAIENAE